MDVKLENVTPVKGRVLVRLDGEPRVTPSGITLPALGYPFQGEIVAMGELPTDKNGNEIPSPLKIGDTVLFKRFDGVDYEISRVKYKFYTFEEILAYQREANEDTSTK